MAPICVGVSLSKSDNVYIFKIDIILNDFWISSTWALKILVPLTEFKKPKNPGIQPSHESLRGLSIFAEREKNYDIYFNAGVTLGPA